MYWPLGLIVLGIVAMVIEEHTRQGFDWLYPAGATTLTCGIALLVAIGFTTMWVNDTYSDLLAYEENVVVLEDAVVANRNTTVKGIGALASTIGYHDNVSAAIRDLTKLNTWYRKTVAYYRIIRRNWFYRILLPRTPPEVELLLG